MFVIGIILLIVGFALAYLATDDRFSKLGYLVAVIGVILIVVAAILAVADESSDSDAIEGVLFGPLALMPKFRLK